jgi:hypothetical protein
MASELTLKMTFIFSRPILSLLAAVALTQAFANPASATPRPLPFTYPPQTLPEGALEVEQYIDMVPSRVARETETGTDAIWSVGATLETELEYGITDIVEGAWYFVFDQRPSPSPALRFEGVKQRVRFPFAPRGVWPVDLGLYLEIGEFHDEIEFEQKLLLGRRFGAFEVLSNLWIEQEWEFQAEQWVFVYQPTLGASYDFSPNLSAGLEYWVRGRFDVAQDPRHYLGPTAMVQRGEYFLSAGAYARLDGLGSTPAVGDPWGPVWIRVLIGIHL